MKAPETIVVNARSTTQASSPGLRPQDILFVFFRHKWKIILLTLLGLAASAAFYLNARPQYASEARILIRYVLEQRSIASDESSSIRTPDSRGDNIINSELEILTSFDITKKVAEAIGATNLVRDPGLSDAERLAAAQSAVQKGLGVDVPRRSNALRITFRHEDPNVARLVLGRLITNYLSEHARIHRGLDFLRDGQAQIERVRGDLTQTEADLRILNTALETVSFEDKKRAVLDQMAKVQSELYATEALYAEQRAAIGLLTNSLAVSTEDLTNSAVEPVPPAQLSAYRNVLARVESLTQEKQRLLLGFTPESPFVKAVDGLLTKAQQEQSELEASTPGLAVALAASPSPSSRSQPNAPSGLDPRLALIQLRALDAKRTTLEAQLSELRTNALSLADNEARYTELTRRRELQNNQLIQLTRAYEQAELEATLSQGRIANIGVVQEATPAALESTRIFQIAGGLAGGGFVLGLVLALLLEFYADGSIRRPHQIERSLRVPLYLSIPRLRLGRRRSKAKESPAATAAATLLPEQTVAAYANGATDENLGPYAEALRDRLMMYFQLQGLNHKPKLVGVTSCGRGAGVTTLATSLAASLSETGDGNVLFVDVNPQRGPSQKPFHHGKLRAGIHDALEEERRDAARVDSNLYMVSLADPTSGRVGVVPKTLAGLVPKMKSSDYDYIIFDLPPITQTSATSKIAGLMDMVFVVLESEKTHADLAKKATDLLNESRANVAAVLNKHRRYLPRSLDTEL